MGLRESNSPTATLDRGGRGEDGCREGGSVCVCVCAGGKKEMRGGGLRRFGRDTGTGTMWDEMQSNKSFSGKEERISCRRLDVRRGERGRMESEGRRQCHR